MKNADRDRIDEKLAKNNLCYVLVTCDTSTVDGNMQVRMSSQGDAALASLMLQGALEIIEDKDQEDGQVVNSGKVVALEQ
jgi:hypothetical protein